jgi:nitrate reductase gamma subunit
VARRIAAEVFLFRTFFHSEQAFWLVIFPFHVVGLLTLVHHALGFGQDILTVYWPFVNLSQYNAALSVLGQGAWLLLAFLLYILIRRLYKSEVRRMSFFSDYVAVLLIAAVVITGTYMTFGSHITASQAWHEAAIKWGKGLTTFQPSPIVDPVFTTHFMFVQLLFIYFPISKLFHPFGQITSRMMTLKEEPLNLEGVVVK